MKIARREGATGSRTPLLGFVLIALLGASLLLAAAPAHAAKSFTVNSSLDSADLSVGNGVCDALASGGEQCTLRAAIQEANHPNNLGADFIGFNIGGGIGVKTISPRSELPAITEQLTINGYTQPGAAENTDARPGKTNARPLVELDGTNVAQLPVDGLDVRAANVVVRGLIINRFPFDGIDVRANADGIVPTGVKIEGNFIGTDDAGREDLGNGTSGVLLVEARNTTVGGTTPDARNLISGNASDGVSLVSADNNKVEGNLVGTRRDGTSGLSNGADGVDAFNSDGVAVGGATPGAGNTVAFNGATGVRVSGATTSGDRILGNSVFLNAGQGIDLAADGRTDNDDDDPDMGPNLLQNFPVLASAKAGRDGTIVKGKLNSTPGRTFTVQFFSNPAAADEGKTFLGQKTVSTGADGDATISFRTRKRAAGTVTATVTDPAGNTSEFSAPKPVSRRR
jgi:hypothetical protein